MILKIKHGSLNFEGGCISTGIHKSKMIWLCGFPIKWKHEPSQACIPGAFTFLWKELSYESNSELGNNELGNTVGKK